MSNTPDRPRRVNKQALIAEMQREFSYVLPALTHAIIQRFLEKTAEYISEGTEVALREIGTVTFTKRPPTKGYNARTGETIDIPAKKFPHLKFNSVLSGVLNGKFADRSSRTPANPPEYDAYSDDADCGDEDC